MIAAGFDVGALTTKAVIVKDASILSWDIVRTRARPEQAAGAALENALKKAGLAAAKVKCRAATGWGRKRVGFADKVISEVPCISRGARQLLPSARTIIDVGGLTSHAIVLTPKGKVLDYAGNDKCAAGAGKFIEAVAEALELDISEFGPVSLQAVKRIDISSQCVVFAESEVVSHVNEGEATADITAGVNFSIASRLATMATRIGVHDDVCVTGGVAKNTGVVRYLSQLLGKEIKTLPTDPQIVSAFGAALAARE
jgi:predicted CoA-substrate-specific enzyme activase